MKHTYDCYVKHIGNWHFDNVVYYLNKQNHKYKLNETDGDTTYYNTYKKMRNGVAIADLFRICYIHKFGGYWFDIYIEPTKLILPTSGSII